MQSSPSYWIVRRALRALQVCVVSVAIYRAGYSSGVVSYAADPERMDKELLRNIASEDDSTTEFHDTSSLDFQRVNSIAMKVIKASKDHCKSEMQAAHKVGKESLEKMDNMLHLVYGHEQIISLHENVAEAEANYEHWESALNRVEGNWKVHLTKNGKTINAFVSDVLPRNLFVQQGLLTALKPTDNELAMIFGHEISHVLLGHSSEELAKSATAQVAQLVFLTFVDPAGLFSLLLEGLSFEATHIFKAYVSRHNEYDADDLGKIIIEKAAFDSVKGANIFLKASQLQYDAQRADKATAPGITTNLRQFMT